MWLRIEASTVGSEAMTRPEKTRSLTRTDEADEGLTASEQDHRTYAPQGGFQLDSSQVTRVNPGPAKAAHERSFVVDRTKLRSIAMCPGTK
jgi:hypothetical protein